MSRMNDPSQQGQQPEQGSVGQSVREMGSQVKEKAGEYYEQGRQKATEYYEQGREKATQWANDVEDYIREQPVKSVLMAAGIGLVLGFIWRRS